MARAASVGELLEHTLGSDDKGRVTVFAQSGLSSRFMVDGTGIISMPLIGKVEVGGQTVRERRKRRSSTSFRPTI